jgi:hypothetical protein
MQTEEKKHRLYTRNLPNTSGHIWNMLLKAVGFKGM